MSVGEVVQRCTGNASNIIPWIGPEVLIFHRDFSMDEVRRDVFKRHSCLQALIGHLINHSAMLIVHLQVIFG